MVFLEVSEKSPWKGLVENVYGGSVEEFRGKSPWKVFLEISEKSPWKVLVENGESSCKALPENLCGKFSWKVLGLKVCKKKIRSPWKVFNTSLHERSPRSIPIHSPPLNLLVLRLP